MNFIVGRGNTKTQMTMAEFVLNQARSCPVCKNKPLMNLDPSTREIRLKCSEKCFADIKYRTEVFMDNPGEWLFIEQLCKAVDYWNQQVDEAVKNEKVIGIKTMEGRRNNG